MPLLSQSSAYSLDRTCQLPGASGTTRLLIGTGCEHVYGRLTGRTCIITANSEHSCLNLTTTILGCMQEFIPNRSITTRPCDPKWWIPECTNAVKAKVTAWKRWYRNKDDHGLKQHFVLAGSQAANAIVTAKSAMQARIRAKLASGSLCDKEWWSTLKSAQGPDVKAGYHYLLTAQGENVTYHKRNLNAFQTISPANAASEMKTFAPGISQH